MRKATQSAAMVQHNRPTRSGAAERSANEALQSAHREMPRITRYLLEKRVARPKLSEHGVSFDGDDRGWLYREDMRSTWAATPGALEWATKVLRLSTATPP